MPFVLPIVESFLLPPGVLLVALVVALVLVLTGRRKAGVSVGVAACILLYLFSIVPVANLLILPLEDHYPPLRSPKGAEAVVVLGGGLVPISPVEHGRPSLSPEALKRVVYGARVASAAGLPLILTGGVVPSQPASEPEAVVAERVVAALGLREKSILLETNSRNTWENGVRVEEHFHPRTVVLVTSAYHMPRSVIAFERNGIRVVPAPTDYLSDREAYTFYSFLPGAVSLRVSAVALKEYLGYLYYRLFLGHHQA